MWQYLGWCCACERRGYARFLLWKCWPSLLVCGIGTSRHGDSEKQNGLKFVRTVRWKFFIAWGPWIAVVSCYWIHHCRVYVTTTMHIRMTLYCEGAWLYCDYFIWVCILYCGCFNLFCNVWMCVFVGFVLCGCFGNMFTRIYCVLYCLYCVFYIVSFMYIYSYLFCLY